jgi:hypothetical protein
MTIATQCLVGEIVTENHHNIGRLFRFNSRTAKADKETDRNKKPVHKTPL